MITTKLLLRSGARCSSERLAVHAAALEAARAPSSINNTRRVAAFIGQIMIETDYLRTLEESFRWRDPDRLDATFRNVRGRDHAIRLIKLGPVAIANCVYANRLGNGDEYSGDGWRFRGGGYKMLTGRENYRNFGRVIGLDLEVDPDLVRTPVAGAQIAVAYWEKTHCSEMADAGDVEGITEAVNGVARLGLAERRAVTVAALNAMGARSFT